MTWETLQPKAEDFGSELRWMEEAHSSSASGAASPETVFLVEAKLDLAREIQARTGLDIDDASQLETINGGVAYFPKQWRYIVSRKQLHLLFEDADQGEGSLNRMKAQRYLRQYQDELLKVRSLFLQGNRPQSHTSVRIAM